MYRLLVAAVATALLQLSAGDRHSVFADRGQQWRQTGGGGGSALPRRLWLPHAAGHSSMTRGGSRHHVGEHLIARRQRHFLTSTMSPVMGHWKSLRYKLEVQSTWPGTARYADETSLPATTVRTVARNTPLPRCPRSVHIIL